MRGLHSGNRLSLALNLSNSVFSFYSTTSSSTASTYVETWPSAAASGSQSNRPAQRMSLITHNQQNLLKSHQDIVTALACIDSPFRGGIVSGDRAGVIKIWRVEPGGT
jgi:phosphoinositide-3-kinase regulatory subunit 4